MEASFQRLADLVAAPIDSIKLIVIMTLSIGLAIPLPYLPRTVAHLYSLACSAFFLCGVYNFRFGAFQLVFMTLVTWSLCKLGVASKLPQGKRPWPWIVFAVTMGQLTINHLYRYIADVSLDNFDITGPMMVLVQRLTLFAWQMYDNDKAKPGQHEPVPLLPFLGYCLFFPSFLIGPAVHYSAYTSYASTPLPPGRFAACAKRYAVAIFFLAVYATQGSKWTFGLLADKSSASNSFAWNLVLINMAGFIARTKYYASQCHQTRNFCSPLLTESSLVYV